MLDEMVTVTGFYGSKTDLLILTQAIPILGSISKLVKADWVVDLALNALGEESTLAILGSYHEDVEVLRIQPM